MISRRALLAGAGVAAFECSRREVGSAGAPGSPGSTEKPLPAPPPENRGPPARGTTRLLEWRFPTDEPERAVAVVPTWGGATARFPVVIALHGRGEALKAPADGAMGWPRDYELVRAMRRLCSPPLVSEDLEGLTDEASLAALNLELAAAPFQGLVVVCPYVPDIDLTQAAALARYARFVTEVLVPRARSEAPSLGAPASTGIDGVSLGGAVALHVGLGNPLAFGAVGAIQPAIRAEDAPAWTERALAARRKNPNLSLRLLTSADDYFRDAVTRTSQAWRAAGIPHEFSIAPGPHDYIFNRGPGSIQLLRWHDRVLARS